MRKDKLSSYQAKKQKLKEIKLIIIDNKTTWEYLKTAKTEEEKKYWSQIVRMPNVIINKIWEIVKDE